MILTIDTFLQISQFVIITFLIIGIIRILKWKGIFTDEFQPVFDRLVTELALPVIIFSVFATSKFTVEILIPAAILFIALSISLCIAYGICRLLRLPSKTTGTIILLAGFGSTATMAIPLITDIFSSFSQAYGQGVIIGTIGVAFPFFTIGVLIASYFGSKDEGGEGHIVVVLKEFLTTPIFIAFVLGFGISILLGDFHMPEAEIFTDVFTHFFEIIDQSLDLLVWISIGLMLYPLKAKRFFPFLGIVVVIKMLIEPAIVMGCAGVVDLSAVTEQVLLFEAAAPSGAIAAVLASRYGCDRSLAGWLVLGTYLISLVSIPLIFLVLT